MTDTKELDGLTELQAYLRERGGTAFPATLTLGDGSSYQCSGLTARDWFAGQALVGIAWDCGLSKQEAAETAYEFADAMLAQRALQSKES